MKWLYVILAVIIPFSAIQASADTFRCPNGHPVSTGVSLTPRAQPYCTP